MFICCACRSHSVDTAASLKETEGKLADANNSLQQTQDTLTATQQQLIEFEQQNKDLQQQLGAEKQQHEKVQQGLKDLQRQHTELQQQQRDAEAAAAAAAEEAAALQEQLAELEGKLQVCRGSKHNMSAMQYVQLLCTGSGTWTCLLSCFRHASELYSRQDTKPLIEYMYKSFFCSSCRN